MANGSKQGNTDDFLLGKLVTNMETLVRDQADFRTETRLRQTEILKKFDDHIKENEDDFDKSGGRLVTLESWRGQIYAIYLTIAICGGFVGWLISHVITKAP
jgi:hypothetical protein